MNSIAWRFRQRFKCQLLALLLLTGVSPLSWAESTEKSSFKARENTHFAALDGLVFSVGDRWAFMPSMDEKASEPSGTSMSTTAPGLRPELSDAGPGITAAEGYMPEGQTIILVENLMLQQIVQAIRADAADRRWRVSGVYLEFFDENRLMILSAKRASVETKSP